jgi:hypothetical protein
MLLQKSGGSGQLATAEFSKIELAAAVCPSRVAATHGHRLPMQPTQQDATLRNSHDGSVRRMECQLGEPA